MKILQSFYEDIAITNPMILLKYVSFCEDPNIAVYVCTGFESFKAFLSPAAVPQSAFTLFPPFSTAPPDALASSTSFPSGLRSPACEHAHSLHRKRRPSHFESLSGNHFSSRRSTEHFGNFKAPLRPAELCCNDPRSSLHR